MELNVRSLLGAVRLRAVPEHWTVEDLKASLHEGYPNLQIPEPKHQNLVHGGRLLSSGLLSTSGVASGATVVLLHTVPPPKTTLPPTTPAPSAMDIRAAIFEEARRRGIEHKLRDEAPVHSHASLNLPHDLMDMDNQLMGLIEALEGRLGLLRQGARGTNYSGRALDAAVEAGLLSAPGDARAGAAAPQASEPIPDIQPPEPDAEHITQLCDMGFPEPVVRKALVLHRNRVPEAVEWLLIHSEDADAGEPVTQEQLRRIYGAPQTRAPAIASRGAAVEGPAPPAAAASTVASALRELQMSLLQAVGIDADSAQGLLDRASDVPGTAPGAAAATATASQAQAQQAGDPLETFRRRLQEQLGEARHDDLDAAANSLAELFPLEALMNLGAGHDDDDDEHHDGEEEEDEEEEEEEGDEEEEDDEEEEEEDAPGQGGAAMPDSLRF